MPDLTPTERLTLLALAACHHHLTGRCTPSQSRLAMMTGFNERTIRRAIASLERAGLIVVTSRPRSYELMFDKTGSSIRLQTPGRLRGAAR